MADVGERPSSSTLKSVTWEAHILETRSLHNLIRCKAAQYLLAISMLE